MAYWSTEPGVECTVHSQGGVGWLDDRDKGTIPLTHREHRGSLWLPRADYTADLHSPYQSSPSFPGQVLDPTLAEWPHRESTHTTDRKGLRCIACSRGAVALAMRHIKGTTRMEWGCNTPDTYEYWDGEDHMGTVWGKSTGPDKGRKGPFH